ncbi:MAG: phosphoglycerate mutase family protein [Chitinophagales bacterium]|nr:phosphoglycerate mutase family protein [Chitinophagales bacterium]
MNWKLYVVFLLAVLQYTIVQGQEDIKLGFVDDESIIQIMLIRHGEPDLKKDGWVGRRGAEEYFRDYDSVNIIIPEFLPIHLKPGEVKCVYTSTLPRSSHTAMVLFGEGFDYCPMYMFREFERRVFNFISLRLPLKLWTTISRGLWIIGINQRDIESFRKAKKRAREGAEFLDERAMEDEKVILVAHGFLNRYLKKYLVDMGYELKVDGGSGYLSSSILVKKK